jgi:hypothetical protein
MTVAHLGLVVSAELVRQRFRDWEGLRYLGLLVFELKEIQDETVSRDPTVDAAEASEEEGVRVPLASVWDEGEGLGFFYHFLRGEALGLKPKTSYKEGSDE